MLRKHIFISGRVQGVYYRVFVRETAWETGVKGWVRNRRDGRVEAILEGEPEAINEAIRRCRQGPPGAFIEKIDIGLEPFTGEFNDFNIVATV